MSVHKGPGGGGGGVKPPLEAHCGRLWGEKLRTAMCETQCAGLYIRVCQCAKSYQMHAPLCMLMHLVINDSEKQIKSYFLHFSIWSKHVEVYVVRICSDRF